MRTETVTPEAIDPKKLFRVLSAYEHGDFSVRMPVDQIGITGKIYDALNHVIRSEPADGQGARAYQFRRRESRQRPPAGASLPSASGEWLACIDSVNTLVIDLVQPNTEVARVIGAVAKGDLSQAMALEIDDRPLTGEFLRTAKIVNTMVEQLSTFASEVTRVARRSAPKASWVARQGSRASPARGRI